MDADANGDVAAPRARAGSRLRPAPPRASSGTCSCCRRRAAARSSRRRRRGVARARPVPVALLERRALVRLDQRRVSDHVGEHHRDEPTIERHSQGIPFARSAGTEYRHTMTVSQSMRRHAQATGTSLPTLAQSATIRWVPALGQRSGMSPEFAAVRVERPCARAWTSSSFARSKIVISRAVRNDRAGARCQAQRGYRASMREVLPGVFHWTTLHPRIHIDVSSYWLDRAGVAIDPLVPSERGLEWFAERTSSPRQCFSRSPPLPRQRLLRRGVRLLRALQPRRPPRVQPRRGRRRVRTRGHAARWRAGL